MKRSFHYTFFGLLLITLQTSYTHPLRFMTMSFHRNVPQLPANLKRHALTALVTGTSYIATSITHETITTVDLLTSDGGTALTNPLVYAIPATLGVLTNRHLFKKRGNEPIDRENKKI